MKPAKPSGHAKPCRNCGVFTYRKGGVCSQCRPISRQGAKGWTKVAPLATLAAANRKRFNAHEE